MCENWAAHNSPNIPYFQAIRSKYWDRTEQFYAEHCLKYNIPAEDLPIASADANEEYDIQAQRKNEDQNTDEKPRKRRRGQHARSNKGATGDQRNVKKQKIDINSDSADQRRGASQAREALAEWAAILSDEPREASIASAAS